MAQSQNPHEKQLLSSGYLATSFSKRGEQLRGITGFRPKSVLVQAFNDKSLSSLQQQIIDDAKERKYLSVNTAVNYGSLSLAQPIKKPKKKEQKISPEPDSVPARSSTWVWDFGSARVHDPKTQTDCVNMAIREAIKYRGGDPGKMKPGFYTQDWIFQHPNLFSEVHLPAGEEYLCAMRDHFSNTHVEREGEFVAVHVRGSKHLVFVTPGDSEPEYLATRQVVRSPIKDLKGLPLSYAPVIKTNIKWTLVFKNLILWCYLLAFSAGLGHVTRMSRASLRPFKTYAYRRVRIQTHFSAYGRPTVEYVRKADQSSKKEPISKEEMRQQKNPPPKVLPKPKPPKNQDFPTGDSWPIVSPQAPASVQEDDAVLYKISYAKKGRVVEAISSPWNATLCAKLTLIYLYAEATNRWSIPLVLQNYLLSQDMYKDTQDLKLKPDAVTNATQGISVFVSTYYEQAYADAVKRVPTLSKTDPGAFPLFLDVIEAYDATIIPCTWKCAQPRKSASLDDKSICGGPATVYACFRYPQGSTEFDAVHLIPKWNDCIHKPLPPPLEIPQLTLGPLHSDYDTPVSLFMASATGVAPVKKLWIHRGNAIAVHHDIIVELQRFCGIGEQWFFQRGKELVALPSLTEKPTRCILLKCALGDQDFVYVADELRSSYMMTKGDAKYLLHDDGVISTSLILDKSPLPLISGRVPQQVTPLARAIPGEPHLVSLMWRTDQLIHNEERCTIVSFEKLMLTFHPNNRIPIPPFLQEYTEVPAPPKIDLKAAQNKNKTPVSKMSLGELGRAVEEERAKELAERKAEDSKKKGDEQVKGPPALIPPPPHANPLPPPQMPAFLVPKKDDPKPALVIPRPPLAVLPPPPSVVVKKVRENYSSPPIEFYNESVRNRTRIIESLHKGIPLERVALNPSIIPQPPIGVIDKIEHLLVPSPGFHYRKEFHRDYVHYVLTQGPMRNVSRKVGHVAYPEQRWWLCPNERTGKMEYQTVFTFGPQSLRYRPPPLGELLPPLPPKGRDQRILAVGAERKEIVITEEPVRLADYHVVDLMSETWYVKNQCGGTIRKTHLWTSPRAKELEEKYCHEIDHEFSSEKVKWPGVDGDLSGVNSWNDLMPSIPKGATHSKNFMFSDTQVLMPVFVPNSTYTKILFQAVFKNNATPVFDTTSTKGSWLNCFLSCTIDRLAIEGWAPDQFPPFYRRTLPVTTPQYPRLTYTIVIGITPNPKMRDFTDDVIGSSKKIMFSNRRCTSKWGFPAIDTAFIRPDAVVFHIPVSSHCDIFFLTRHTARNTTITSMAPFYSYVNHFKASEARNLIAPGFNVEVMKNRFAVYLSWKTDQGNVQSPGFYGLTTRLVQPHLVEGTSYSSVSGAVAFRSVSQLEMAVHTNLRRLWPVPLYIDCKEVIESAQKISEPYSLTGKTKKVLSNGLICCIYCDPIAEQVENINRLECLIDCLLARPPHIRDLVTKALPWIINRANQLDPWYCLWWDTPTELDYRTNIVQNANSLIAPVDLVNACKNLTSIESKYRPFYSHYFSLEVETFLDDYFGAVRQPRPNVGVPHVPHPHRLHPQTHFSAYGLHSKLKKAKEIDVEAPYPLLKSQIPGVPVEVQHEQPIGLPQGTILEDFSTQAPDAWFRDMEGPNRVLRRMTYYPPESPPTADYRVLIDRLIAVGQDPTKPDKPYVTTGVIGEAGGHIRHPFVCAKSALNTVRTFLSRHAGTRIVEDPLVKRMVEPLFRRKANKIAKKMLRILDENPPLLDFESYLTEVEASKRKTYKAGYEKFMLNFNIPIDLQGMMKNNETAYVDQRLTPEQVNTQNRPRAIFNPPDENKAILGWMNHILIQLVKAACPAFVHGLDLDELEARMTQQVEELGADIAAIAGDGSGHDSHQHYWWIECVDNVVLGQVIPEICARLGLDKRHCDAILKAATMLEIPFVVFYPGTRNKLMKGFILGTVFSGHPTRTTFGNTLRVIILYQVVMDLARVPKDAYRLNISGDDSDIFIKLEYLTQFMVVLRVITVDTARPGGIGYYLKKVDISDSVIDFLSKTGKILPTGSVVITRIPERIILGGNVSQDLRKDFDVFHHSSAVTVGFLHYKDSHPLIESYIDYRTTNLKEKLPNARNVANLVDKEARYKLIGNKHMVINENNRDLAMTYLNGTKWAIHQGYQPTSLFYEDLPEMLFPQNAA